MRLIDADVLKELILRERDAIPKTIVERYSFGVEMPNKHGDSMRGGIRKALRCMEQCPTIDAEPVRHGLWNRQTVIVRPLKSPATIWRCSLCNGMNRTRSHYCPNCGAKMQGDINE